MIKLLEAGRYKLIETKHHTKVLYLKDTAYAWVEPKNIGEILVATRRIHKLDCILSVGEYKLYDVEDEPRLSDHTHLELAVGEGQWQGYLLLTGLPSDKKIRARIIPTPECITDDPDHIIRRGEFTLQTKEALL